MFRSQLAREGGQNGGQRIRIYCASRSASLLLVVPLLLLGRWCIAAIPSHRLLRLLETGGRLRRGAVRSSGVASSGGRLLLLLLVVSCIGGVLGGSGSGLLVLLWVLLALRRHRRLLVVGRSSRLWGSRLRRVRLLRWVGLLRRVGLL